MPRPRPKFPAIRDVILLIAGLALLGHETLVVTEPRYLLIGIAAAMIGLPATLLADRQFVTSGSSTPADPPPAEPPPADPPAPGRGAAA